MPYITSVVNTSVRVLLFYFMQLCSCVLFISTIPHSNATELNQEPKMCHQLLETGSGTALTLSVCLCLPACLCVHLQCVPVICRGLQNMQTPPRPDPHTCARHTQKHTHRVHLALSRGPGSHVQLLLLSLYLHTTGIHSPHIN